MGGKKTLSSRLNFIYLLQLWQRYPENMLVISFKIFIPSFSNQNGGIFLHTAIRLQLIFFTPITASFWITSQPAQTVKKSLCSPFSILNLKMIREEQIMHGFIFVVIPTTALEVQLIFHAFRILE